MADEEVDPKCAKAFCIPQRFILGIMTSFSLVNCYTLRVSLSTAMTEMDTLASGDTSSPCVNVTKNVSSDHNSNSISFDWNAKERGYIMSTFYLGYVVSHMPGGYIADKYGAKHVLGCGILLTGIFTIITPPVLYLTNGSVPAFVGLRVLEGFFEGPSYPAANVILGQWIPASERGFWGSVVYSGSQFGTIMSNAISGQLIESTGRWSSVFYFFGLLAIVWWLVWLLLCYSTPEMHPCISVKEKMYLREQLDNEHVSKLDEKPVPWGPIFKSVPVWAMVFTQIGHDWGWFTMVTDLPKYMKGVLGFAIQMNGFLSAIPYFCMWVVSLSSGLLCDYLCSHDKLSITTARKLFNSIGSVGPGVFLVLAGHVGCSAGWAVAMFTLALSTMGTFYCGLKVNALDLSPNYAGVLMAITNGIGAITGFCTSYLTSVVTSHNTFGEWQLIFYLAFFMLFSTNVVFLIFGSGEEQWWNDTTKVVQYYKDKKAEKEARREARAQQ